MFKMKTKGGFHDLYLKKDVLLLANVLEKFIDLWFENNGLDPCNYFNSPGLSWDLMLKMTGIELELISEIKLYLLVEKGMRGGISCIAERCSKANNEYPKFCDNTNPCKCIMYLDANKLYVQLMR